jgi:hypothetical protein
MLAFSGTSIVQGALDPLAIMLTREAELGKFLHLDFVVLLRTTPSIYALLGMLKVVTR